MENEIWKDIAGYEGLYQVSNFGRVKSLMRTIERQYECRKSSFLTYPEKILTIQRDKFGYSIVSLSINSNRKTFKVHQLVLKSFIHNSSNKRAINHINGIKTDNRLNNLEWSTHSENTKHALKTGLKTPQQLGKCGRFHSRSKPVVSINITAIVEHESINQCAKYFSVSDKAIHEALKKGFKCKGNTIQYL